MWFLRTVFKTIYTIVIILLSSTVVLKLLCTDGINGIISKVREIPSTAARKLLLAIEIHIIVCGLQATHRSTIVAGLLRQSCLIKLSLLGGVWMANRWLIPRGRWRILRELRENREFRWVIGGYIHAYWIWDFEGSLNLVDEANDGQLVAHFWRQEYDFWSSPLKACLQKVASFEVCVVLCNPLWTCWTVVVSLWLVHLTCLLKWRILIGTCLLELGILIGICLLQSVPLIFELATTGELLTSWDSFLKV